MNERKSVAKYRYLERGETVNERMGDEYKDPADRKWKATGASGATVLELRSYRRPLPEREAPRTPANSDARGRDFA